MPSPTPHTPPEALPLINYIHMLRKILVALNPTYYRPFGATSDIGGGHSMFHLCYPNETFRD